MPLHWALRSELILSAHATRDGILRYVKQYVSTFRKACETGQSVGGLMYCLVSLQVACETRQPYLPIYMYTYFILKLQFPYSFRHLSL